MIEIIKAEFFAGEIKSFMIQGEYLEILESAYPIDVAMMDRSGAQLSTMRNAEASYFSRPGKYEVIQITSAIAQTVRLFIGSGDAGTRRTSGEVSVIDGGKSRTIANNAFLASGYCASQIGKLAISELYNNGGAGKKAIISSITVASATANVIALGFNNAPTSNLLKFATSKLTGGISSTSIAVRYQSVDAIPGTFIELMVIYVPANETIEFKLNEPLILLANRGLQIYASVAGTDLRTSFEFFEE